MYEGGNRKQCVGVAHGRQMRPWATEVSFVFALHKGRPADHLRSPLRSPCYRVLTEFVNQGCGS